MKSLKKNLIKKIEVFDHDELSGSGSDALMQGEDQGYKFPCKFDLQIELHANHEGLME